MVEIPSPSLGEEELSLFLEGEMSRLGYAVARDSVGNVIGSLGGGSPSLLLCGHMDTVATQIPVKVEDGKLHGRGAVDAKAPLAAMIVAAARSASGFKGTLTVAGVVDEEGQSKGIKNLIKSSVGYDWAIFGEPTNVDTITVGYKGNLALKITCETETGHSSAPWLFENSIEKATEIWSEIKALCTQPVDGHYFNTLTGCIRRMEGGQANNIVPPLCEFQVDLRIPPGTTVEGLEHRIKGILSDYRSRNPKVQVSYERTDYTKPYLSPKRTLIMKALSSAIYRTRGTQVTLMTRTGTGDMNVFGNETCIPCVTYGPGDGHYDHTPNEQIKLNDYLDSVEVLTKAILLIGEYYEKRTKTPLKERKNG